jgi:ATP-binding cassette, subfamily B, bacterial
VTPPAGTPSAGEQDEGAAGRLVRGIVKRNWAALGGAGASTVLLTIADLLQPWPLKWVIDDVLLGRSGSFSFSGDEIRTLVLIAGAVVAIALLNALATYTGELWLKRAGERVSHELRVAMYGHLQRLSLAFHDRRQKGDLVTRLTEDANSVGLLFSDVVGTMAQAVLVLVGMAIVTLLIDPLLGLAMFGVAPILWVVTNHYRARVKSASRAQRRHEGEMASIAAESLSAMRVVKAFGGEEYERDRVVERSEQRRRFGVEAAGLQARFGGAVDLLGAGAMAVVLVVGAFRVASGAITTGDLVVIAQYARRMYRPLSDLAKQSAKAAKYMARAERVAEVLAADQVLEDRPGAHAGGRANGAIELDGVSFGYEPGRPILNDVSLRIEPGSHVAVVGSSGAGKSTVGALIARFYDPDSGRVLIDGRDARDCSLPWLRDQVGLLLQDTVLFTGTLADNIAYGRPCERAEIVRAARVADADDFISRLPDGYDQELGPQGVGLSGGQRQRLGIARVVLRDPPILLLDEPTTGLDAASEAQVMEGMAGLMDGRTTVLITHSMALARQADRVLVVDRGTIVQDGRPDELIGVPGPFRRLATEQGLVERAARRPLPPADRAIPALRSLLDADTVAPALQRSLGTDAPLEDVAMGRVLYRPNRGVVVLYEASVDGERHEVVARAGADGELRALAADPGSLAIARAVNGRAPARLPLAYDDGLGALIHWLPLDLDLPLMNASPGRIADELRGLGVPRANGGELLRVSYTPGRRATLRHRDHVLRGYATERAYRRAVAGWRLAPPDRGGISSAVPAVPLTGAFVGAVDSLRATVHVLESDYAPGAPVAAAYEAGTLLRRLHRLAPDGITPVVVADTLAAAQRSAAVVRAVAPELTPQVDDVVARLERSAPHDHDAVAAHGNFQVGQLVRRPGDLAVADLERACVAAPALDLATYAADAAARDGAGADTARAVLDGLLEGYRARPAGLRWHLSAALLRKAERPFRNFEPDWPERVGEIVESADAALAS